MFTFTFIVSFISVFLAVSGAPLPLPLPRRSEKLSLHPQQQSFSFDLTSRLPAASHTLTTLPAPPPRCITSSSPDSAECPGTMTATNVTYDDCGDAWTVCRCEDADMSLDSAVDRLGRVPVGLRRFLGVVVVLKNGEDSAEPHAYTLTNGDVHLFGESVMQTWLHEAFHAYDYATPSSPISGTQPWLDALANDTCVPDDYATTNPVEDLAQIGVLKIYTLAHGNGTLPDGFEYDCMRGQMEFVGGLALFNGPVELFGNTCASEGGEEGLNLGVKNVIPPAVLNTTKTFPLPEDEDEGDEDGEGEGEERKKLMSTIAMNPSATSLTSPIENSAVFQNRAWAKALMVVAVIIPVHLSL